MHARSIALSLAHPWLPLARRVAAPASRRYFAGWFAEHEIHVLAPERARAPGLGGAGLARGAAAHAAARVRAPRAGRQQPGPAAAVLDRALPPVRALGVALRGRRRLALGTDPALPGRDRAPDARGRAARVPARARPTRCCSAARCSRCSSAGGAARGGRAGHEPAGARRARADRRGLRRPLAAVERDWREDWTRDGVGVGGVRHSGVRAAVRLEPRQGLARRPASRRERCEARRRRRDPPLTQPQ